MSRLGNIGGRLYRGEVSYDFVGRQKRWYTISAAILVIAIAALFIRGLDYSVDFKGGSVFQFSVPASAHATQPGITSTASGAGATVSSVTVTHPVNGGKALWNVQTGSFGTYADQNKVSNAIASAYHISRASITVNSVSSSWGSQISKKALEALIAFLIVIVIYLTLAFEWRMATAALVALAHDIVITVGIYALAGFQVSPATVIGLLTILGYSLYDTVVVFDKVRENTAGLMATRRSTYSQAANLALNQTLVRSINTSLIALLPVVSILLVGINLLGNGELKDLSLVLFVGMLSGTYSSICIATPVLADLKERQPEFKQLAKQLAQRATSTKRQAKVTATAPASGGNGKPAASAVPEPVGDEPVEQVDDVQDAPPAAPLAASRASGAAAARPAGSGQRQQPRRSNAAQRRPAGKKKRR